MTTTTASIRSWSGTGRRSGRWTTSRRRGPGRRPGRRRPVALGRPPPRLGPAPRPRRAAAAEGEARGRPADDAGGEQPAAAAAAAVGDAGGARRLRGPDLAGGVRGPADGP